MYINPHTVGSKSVQNYSVKTDQRSSQLPGMKIFSQLFSKN